MHLRLSKVFPAVLCTVGLAGPALAQGSNDCSTATAISGVGTYSVVTTGATDSAQQTGGACPTIHKDVWFKWTATSSGTIDVSMCGGSSNDTVIAVYNGSVCPASGSQINCNDDSCNLQSDLQFAATSGNTYMIQIGTYDATTFSGSVAITVYVPPPPCTPVAGPDVIVGDIGEIVNYPGSPIAAISLGTESCDPGQTWVNWFQSTNLHPVIGGSLYQYHVVSGSGRFEQLGQSWLKHAFYALSEILCCPTCVSTDGTHLGVGCADTYTASRNGSQAGLGPKWQVNPTTGVFPYPPANPGFSGGVARRLEYVATEVDTTAGTRYFGEAQYVTQDDAAAGNQNNNASYRELTHSGVNFALSGATQRTQSAIRAWHAVDASVVENDVQVDGLFIVAYKTTNLGGGQYHYEYGVYNMNSDRAAGSFSVPVGAGVSITNIGFHGVIYRDGDGVSGNYSSTPWTGAVAGGAITWACATQVQDANANAIRWGTTYNFRFDANVAPASASATLGLWKAGSPGSVTTSVDAPGNGGPTSFAYCAGDGSGTGCPCGNNSALGANLGCLNSLGTGGGLVGSGTSSISADSFVLTGSGMPNSSALYFQGTAQQSGGAGSVFGDGLRCATGTVIRLGTETNAGGGSHYPTGADLSVSVKGADAAGNVRMYQCWYRNPAAFCNPETYNVTNGWQTTWVP